MRDLPPQADAITLAAPVQAFLELFAAPWVVVGVLPERELLGFASTAPPDDRRPLAAPVGIVRLQT